MENQLSHITTQYKRFTKNQVLTEGHLNEVLDYFDDQIRLSRVCLSGVGIACGFRLDCPTPNSLRISQGSAITTDGDLFQLYDYVDGNRVIDLESKTYTHFKVYTQDPELVIYDKFHDEEDNQIPLYELLTGDNDDEAQPISDLAAVAGIPLKDGVALLYLENYIKQQDLCVSLSCDNQGDEIVGNYKVLLTTQAGAAFLKGDDDSLKATNFERLAHSLPEVWHNRAVMLKEDFTSYPVLKNKFAQETLKNNVISRIKNGYQMLMNAFSVNQLYGILELKVDELFSFGEDNVPPDFQYRYDLLRDLIDTYTEAQTVLKVSEAAHCCADLDDFPKHIMLGELDRSGACYEYRHGFYKAAANTPGISDICGDCDPEITTSDSAFTVPELVLDYEGANLSVCYSKESAIQHVKSLIKRALMQLTNYNSNYNFIKITPTFHLGPLKNKAIPFYYNVGNQLIASWNFERTVVGKQHNVFSYHNGHLRIKEPLNYTFDTDFYRVEGHQGMNYLDAVNIITEAKRLKSLGFNVVALPINATEAQPVIENYTSYFLTRNVGLDHKAGVVPGGTLVLIYIEGEYDDYPYPYGYGYPYGYPTDGSPFGGDFEALPEGEGTTVLNPVVADFMLPYLCCDHNLAELRLPVDSLCFDNGTQPLPFEVKPDGGFVSADVELGLNGGVVLNDAGTFAFDARLVSPELYGTPIRFKVNNLETECEITVNQRVIFEIDLATIAYDRPSNTATATFSINGTDIPTDQAFEWDFGDGSPELVSTSLSVDHVFNLGTVGDSGVIVRARTENGDCSSSDNLAIVFEVFAEISLDQNRFCSNDSTAHPFTIVPEGADVEIVGEGASRQDGQWVFVATDVPDGVTSVSFTVDGDDAGLTVEIEQAPTAGFTVAVLEDVIEITNTSSITDRYIFTIDGEERTRLNRRSFTVPLSSFSTDTIEISLIAESDLCGQDSFGPETVIVNQGGSSCVETASEVIAAGLQRIEDINNDPQANELQSIAFALLESVKGRYDVVQGDLEAFLNGSRNSDMVELFNETFFSEIRRALNIAETDFQRQVAQDIFELVTRLLYTLMNCQDNDLLVESQPIFKPILDAITITIVNASDGGISVDEDGSLAEYYSTIVERYNEITYIAEAIDAQRSQL